MSEITVKGKIVHLYPADISIGQWSGFAITTCVPDSKHMSYWRCNGERPADWQEGQEVEITIRAVTK